jgi:hypothetical protein
MSTLIHGSIRRERSIVFSKVIEINSWIGERISGGKVETPGTSGMPLTGTVLWPGGQVTDECVLGTLETKRYEGQASYDAIVLNRMAAAPEPPPRRSSSDRSRNLDDRLRALGVRVADR